MNELKIEYIDINKITPYENNARKHQKDDITAIKKSIESFGMNDPIGIWSDKNIIIEGHGRLLALKELGYETVPCIRLDQLTDQQRKAYALAHNKTAELSEWDLDKLSEELKFIDMDMEQFGFEDLEKSMERDVLEDNFDENEELPVNPYAKKGDVFVLGNHRLMCGDSTLSDDVKKLVDGKVIDMIFTDPPYNVDYEGTAGKIQNDKQSNESFFKFLTDAFNNMYEAVKPGGVIYCCHADTEGVNFRTAFQNAGFKLAECLIWEKDTFVFGRQDYHWKHEPILYGWREGEAHYFVDDHTQDTIWIFPKPKHNDLHPTMKPLELVGRAIKNSSRKNENVLDLFGGSGSTLIASEQIERNAFLMELDERFVDVIVKRYLRFVQSYDNSYLIRDGKKIALSDIADYNVEFTDLVL